MKAKSEWRDLNPRPSVPKTDALARLRHTPCKLQLCKLFICQVLLRWLFDIIVAQARSAFGSRGTRRSVAVPNGEGVASGSATSIIKFY